MPFNFDLKSFTRSYRFVIYADSEDGDTIRQSTHDLMLDDLVDGLNELAALNIAYNSLAEFLASGAEPTKYTAGTIIRVGDQFYQTLAAAATPYHEVTVSGDEGAGGLRVLEVGSTFTTRARAAQGNTLGLSYITVAGIPYAYDASGTDLTTGDTRTWTAMASPIFQTFAAMVASTGLWVGAEVIVLNGWNKEPEKFTIVAAATYTANADTVRNLSGISGQAVSRRKQFRSLVELLADTRAAGFFAADPSSDAEDNWFHIPGNGSSFEMALSGASDQTQTTAGGVKLYARDAKAGFVTGGTSTAYTITSPNGRAIDAYYDGMTFDFIAHATCGASPTMNRDGKGAKALKVADPDTPSTINNVASGQIVINNLYRGQYLASEDAVIVSGIDQDIAAAILLDEDDFVSNSATKAPSQQSTKAYVDGEVSALSASVDAQVGNIAIFVDQKSSGTGGGSSSTSFATRTLNTVEHNGISGASLNTGTSRFTLPVGTYEIEASAPGYNCVGHQAVLYNVTDAAVEKEGTSEECDGSSGDSSNRSFIVGVFTVTGGDKDFEIQQAADNVVTNGWGAPANKGINERYTIVKVRKIA